MRDSHALGLIACLLAAGFPAGSQPNPPRAEPLAHFHHLHLNSADPESAIEFYTTRFSGQRRKFEGRDAVWTGKGWLLFHKVNQPPPSGVVASLYHLGWGARDIQATYRNLLSRGVKFETPLTDLFDLLGTGSPGRGYYAYVDGPDHALIELNRGNTDDFQHIHLLADDPVASSEWYVKEFGIPRRGPAPSREPRFHNGIQVGPLVFLNLDGILFAWFPTGTARGIYPRLWDKRTHLEASQGRVIDHFAFRVDHLDATLARLRKDGVRVLSEPGAASADRMRSAFVQAPDRVRLELVEAPAAQ